MDIGQHYFQIEPKFEIDPQRNAVSFPIGFSKLENSRLVQFGARSFSNFYLNRRAFYCLSVSGMALVNLDADNDWGGALLVNNVFNFGLPYRLYVRPQLGIDATALLYSVQLGFLATSLNFGLGIGKEF